MKRRGGNERKKEAKTGRCLKVTKTTSEITRLIDGTLHLIMDRENEKMVP